MTTPDRALADSVELERRDSVATITLNRPERRNALDIRMRGRFGDLVAEAVDDPDVRAIVLTGRGGHFCAGGDLTSMGNGQRMGADAGRSRMRDALRPIRLLHDCEMPVIAAVEGCAYGGGFGLALLADLVVVSTTARFCLSFAKVGLVPDCAALFTLPRMVGVQRAKELVFSGRELDAQTAHSWGIALEVVPVGSALKRAQQIAQALTTASGPALGMAKVALNQSLSSTFQMMVEYEAAAQGVAFSTGYHGDAVSRYLDKQPPAFSWPGTQTQ